jgi:hypothetical protein
MDAEEEESADCGGGLEMTMDRTRKQSDVSGGVSAFTTLGTLVLTARPYLPGSSVKTGSGGRESGGEDGNGTSLQGEIFHTVNKESLLMMQEHMEKLWCERIPMCIEVKGQATPSPNESSVLLEQWLIQVLPRRCACVGTVCVHM